MPPEKKKTQPSIDDRKHLVDWLETELKRHSSNNLSEKLTAAKYGNYVDHEKLFSGEYKDLKGFTYDRKWLISEFIFNDKMNQLYEKSFTRSFDGDKKYLKSYSHTLSVNPFLLPKVSGVL